jgi:hypothetical protein
VNQDYVQSVVVVSGMFNNMFNVGVEGRSGTVPSQRWSI